MFEGVTIEQIGIWAAAIIGAASLVTKAFAKIAKVTPNTKDDELASTAAKWVSKAVWLVDKLALNPSSDEASKK